MTNPEDRSDTDFVAMITKAGELMAQKKYADAISSYEKALPYLLRTKDDEKIGNCYFNIGISLEAQEVRDWTMVSENFEKALPYLLRTKDDEKIGNCYYNIGISLEAQEVRDRKKELENFEKALPYFLRTKDDVKIGLCYLNIGTSLKAQEVGDRKKVLENFEKALPYFLRTKDDKKICICYFCIGAVLKMQEVPDRKKEIESFEKALPYFLRTKNDEEIGDCYLHIGVSLEAQEVRDWTMVSENFEKALPYLLRTKDDEKIGLCYLNIGVCLKKQEVPDRKKALENFENALLYYIRAIGSEKLIKDLCKELNFLYERYQNVRKAILFFEKIENEIDQRIAPSITLKIKIELIKYYIKALYFGKAHKKSKSLILLIAGYNSQEILLDEIIGVAELCAQSPVLFESGIQLYETLIPLIHKLEKTEYHIKCFSGMGELYLQMSQFEDALRCFFEVENVFCDRIDTEIQALNSKRIGECNFKMAQALVNANSDFYLKAEEKFLEAFDLYHQNENTVEKAQCKLLLGDLYSLNAYQIDDQYFLKAMSAYEEVKPWFNSSDNLSILQFADFQIGLLKKRVGDYNSAIKIFEKLAPNYEKFNEMHNFFASKIKIASCLLCLHNQLEANKIFYQIYKDPRSHDFRVEALLGMVNISVYQQEKQLAIQYLKEAIDLQEVPSAIIMNKTQSIQHLESISKNYYDLIELFIDKKDFGSALVYVDRLKSRYLSSQITKNTHHNIDNFEKFKILSEEIVHGKRSAGQNIDRITDLKKKEDGYLQMLKKIRETEPEFDPDQLFHISEEEIQGLPDDETAIVSLFPMNARTIVFIVIKGKSINDTSFVIDGYGEADLNADYQSLKGVEHDDGNNNEAKVLTEIMDKFSWGVFKETNDFLVRTSTKRIIFIPYSTFHLIPFHAMTIGLENEKWIHLCDRYLVSYAPSLKILQQCLNRKRPGTGKKFISFANPKDTDELKFGAAEFTVIQKHLGKGETQCSEYTSCTDFNEKAKEAELIHYTGHSDEKGLVLYSDEDSPRVRKEQFKLNDIANSDYSQTILVTLGGCKTSKTEIFKVDEFTGVNTAFLCAGARTAVGSLWAVNDLTTLVFMDKFYAFLKDVRIYDPTVAMAETQRWMKNPDNRAEHEQALAQICKTVGFSLEDQVIHINRLNTEGIRHVAKDEARVTQIPVNDLLDKFSDIKYWAPFTISGAWGAANES